MSARNVIKGFESLSPQEVFDMACNHLLTQNASSLNAEGECVYRGPNGLKCAAGIFLTEEGAAECEGSNWFALAMEGRVPHTNRQLIQDLQHVHDGRLAATWSDALRKLAEQYYLVYPSAEF